MENISPLHQAVLDNDTTLIKMLLGQGVDINAQDYECKTPLCMVNNKDSADLLLVSGADIRVQDKYGNTPLHAVASGKNAQRSDFHDLIEVVATLLANGADPDARNNANASPLFGAISAADSENWIKPQEDDPSIAIIKLLLSFKATINIQDIDGWTPLHLISYRNHARMLPLFLENGADIHVKNNNGQTPLYVAIAQSNLKIVKLLLEAGAEVNMQDTNLMTPLHVAVSFDVFESWENVQMRAYSDELEYALTQSLLFSVEDENLPVNRYGLKEMVALLLEHGADCTAQDKDGKTPHMIALEKGHRDIAQLLEEYEKNKFK